MPIDEVIVKNFKALKNFRAKLNLDLNIIVGDNESGKSTLLEAINLCLTSQLNNKWINQELSPYLFNIETTQDFIRALQEGRNPEPPEILIEVYLTKDSEYMTLRGSINSLRADLPGLSLTIKLSKEYLEEYKNYISNPSQVKAIPTEYFEAYWYSFSNNPIAYNTLQIKPVLLDSSSIRLQNGTDYYIQRTIQECLSPQEKASMSILYRLLKEKFAEEDTIKSINARLESAKGVITEKLLSISLDISHKSNWDSNITSYLDDIPYVFIGKGEQSVLKTMFALQRKNARDAQVFLIEEPENHLSYTNMSILIKKISDNFTDKQIIITTHSTFVSNKLGLSKLILLNFGGVSTDLGALSKTTQDYFMKLPGYDTLRLIIAKRVILVEGPSDELIVQKAHLSRYNRLPIDVGLDIISVRGLSFKRFLEIAVLLKKPVSVITDNDGNTERLQARYAEYIDNYPFIRFFYPSDNSSPTMEYLLFDSIGLETLNKIFIQSISTKEDMVSYMKQNKVQCALQIFDSQFEFDFPDYIVSAIE